MENRVCCCFGHRDVYKDVSSCLNAIIEELIISKGVRTFFTGGMGQFDEAFASAVRAKKRVFPGVELVLVYPYLIQRMNVYKDWYEQNYDSVFIPSDLAGLHYKSAIKARNRWLVEHSDFIVSYVYRNFGGAYDAVQYARKRGKVIYNTAPHTEYLPESEVWMK